MNKKYLSLTIASLLCCIASANEDGSESATQQAKITVIDSSSLHFPLNPTNCHASQSGIDVGDSAIPTGTHGVLIRNNSKNTKESLALQASGIAFATYAANNLAKDLGYEKAMLVTDFAHKSALTNALARGINLPGTKQSFIKCKGNLGDQVESLGSAAAIEFLACLFTQVKYGKYLNKKYDEFFEYYNIKTIGNLGKQGAKAFATIQVASLFKN
jgi:hypothetical protein